MGDIDLEGLRKFASRSDRSAPPYFAGRKEILDDIAFAAEDCWSAWQQDRGKTEGATRVIYGAPGAGKSAILKHLEHTWVGPGGGAPTMLRLATPADFMNGVNLAKRLTNLLRPGLGEKVGQAIQETWGLRAGIGGTGGQVGREASKPPPLDPINAVLQLLPGGSWTGPVVIAIDEFQNAKGHVASPHALVLQKLHEQEYDAPIMAVLVGLSDTLDTVDRLGVSRRSVLGRHSLGRLDEDDTRDLIVGWSEHFRVPDGAWRDTVLDLVRTGSHWPAHIHNALASFAEQVVRVEGDMELVDLARAEAGAQARRETYYRDRMSPELWQSKWLLAAVVADVRDGMDSGDVINLIEEHAKPASQDVRWRLPEGKSPRGYYHHTLRRGVLQEDGPEVTTPIPCLRNWITRNCTAPVADADADVGTNADADSSPPGHSDPYQPPTVQD